MNLDRPAQRCVYILDPSYASSSPTKSSKVPPIRKRAASPATYPGPVKVIKASTDHSIATKTAHTKPLNDINTEILHIKPVIASQESQVSIVGLETSRNANTITSAMSMYLADIPQYLAFGDGPTTVATVELVYPGNTREIYPLVVPKSSEEFNPITDLYHTVQMIGRHCFPGSSPLGDEQSGFVRGVMKAIHKKQSHVLANSVLEFNAAVIKLRSNLDTEPIKVLLPTPYYLMVHILEQSYSRVVAPDSHVLNVYEGFSNNVYGEIKTSFVHDLIAQCKLTPESIFIDLGSGIGNVVLQVAAECLCDSYGIEMMENPARLAKKQKNEFLARMQSYLQPCGKVFLKRGDFLSDSSIDAILPKADVIFVNNYAFDSELNQNILAKFLDLKEGCIVISLRAFLPVSGRQQGRRQNAIENIFTVREYSFGRDKVSWMMEGGNYFIHVVDRSTVSDYKNT